MSYLKHLTLAALLGAAPLAAQAKAPQTTFSTLYAFAGPSAPNDGTVPMGGVEYSNGALYGATAYAPKGQNLFKVDAKSGAETSLGLVPGQPWTVNLIGGELYVSTIQTGASLFGYNIASGTGSTLLNLDGDIQVNQVVPVGSLVYGSTLYGGAYGAGMIYSYDPATGMATTVYNFTNGATGKAPWGPLLSVGKLLYGTTANGGSAGQGVVYELNPATGKTKPLWNFSGGTDGGLPLGMVKSGGLLYGLTLRGGANGLGCVYSINPKTRTLTTVYSFAGGSDGSTPYDAPLLVKGYLYGTTSAGGPSNDGAVFKIDIATGAETTLHTFTGSDGATPVSPLTYHAGIFYGTTEYGGYGNGTVFSFTDR